MSELCEELIIDILLRLPVKSLLRFRCVSKLWCELIDSKYFISMHCQQSINSNTNFHLIFQKHLDNLYSYSEYFDDDGLNRSLTTIDNPMKCSTIGSCSCKVMFCSVVGCCNGLLCIYHSDFDYVLWNPFTRRYNKLPQAPELVFAPAKKQILHGFGYDHENDDYKVLRIFQIFDPDDFDGKDSIIRNQICVYSLRMNSWKHIEDYPYGDYNYEFQDNHGQGCFVNGASHWLVYPLILNENECQVQGLKWAIVAFNFEVEKFSTIPHPNANRYGEGIQIENLGGFLCICEEVCGTCEVWVMKQYGVGESWVKLHSLKLKYLNIDPALFLKPLAYSKKGENLLMKTDFDALTKYNLKEETSSIIRFPKIVGWGYCYMCLESLVSPHNGGDEGIAAQ